MAIVTTERIFTVIGADLLPREGDLIIDDVKPMNTADIDGPLHVVSIFLNIRNYKRPNIEPVNRELGYLVTRVDHDGSGIIVGGDLIEQKPEDWVNPHLTEMWAFLYNEDYSPQDFELPKLHAYFQHQFRVTR